MKNAHKKFGISRQGIAPGRILLFIFMFSAFAMGSSAIAANITGVVYYSETPLENVSVELRSGPPDYNTIVDTDTTTASGDYAFNNVVDGQYQVRAYGPTAEFITWQGWSYEVSGADIVADLYLSKNIILLTPANLSTVDTLTPTLTWTANAEAASYIVQINRTSDWLLIDHPQNVPEAFYTIPPGKLVNGETYTWQVDARNGNGNFVGGTMLAFQLTVDLVDSDNDGMDDSWETTYFGDLSHDGFADTDNDGLTDLGEFENDTDPNNNDSDGDLMSDGWEVEQVTDPNDNTKFPNIPIDAAITHVHRPDGLFTYLEVSIQSWWLPDVGWFEPFTGNLGPLPNDIDAITVTGPGGTIAEYPTTTGWEYYPQWKDFFIALPGSPATGTYTFTVEVNLPGGGTLTGTATDDQDFVRILPIPDYNTFTPAWDSTLSLKDPTFSWDLVEYLEGGSPIPLYYRLEINEHDGERIFANSYPLQQDMDSYTLGNGILNPGQRYRDRVRVYDHPDWKLANNRAHNTWVYFNVESDPKRLQAFQMLVFKNSEYQTGILESSFLVVPGYKNMLLGATLTMPNPARGAGGIYTFNLDTDKFDWDVPCRWLNLWAHAFGTVETADYGEYTLTVQFADGAKETYSYNLQPAAMQGVSSIQVEIYDDGGAGVSWIRPPTGDYYYEVILRDSSNKEYFRYPSTLNIDDVYLSSWDLRCLEPGAEYRWLVRAFDELYPNRNAAWTEEISMTYSPTDLTHTTWYGAQSWRGQLAVGFDVRPGSWDDIMVDPALVDPAFVEGPADVFVGEPDPYIFIFNLMDDWDDLSTETRINRGWWRQDPIWTIMDGDYTFTLNFDEDGDGDIDATEEFTDTLSVASVAPVTNKSIDVNEETGAVTVNWVEPVGGQTYNIRFRKDDLEYYRSPNVEGDNTVTASWWDLRGMEPGQYRWHVRAYSPDFRTMDEGPPLVFNYYPFDADDDGIVDAFDNCRDIVNPKLAYSGSLDDCAIANDLVDPEENWQPDFDCDGLGDACDAFDSDPEESLDTDGDGIGNNADTDDDGDGLSDIAEAGLGTDPLNNDTDDDGVSDGSADPDGAGPIVAGPDNCPTVPNDQTDTDLDGAGDACDVCPNDAADDEDADGYCADVDNCPEAFNGGDPQPDLDADGLGNACDPDADNDGFGKVDFSVTCCADYWAVYDGETGDLLRVYNEGDILAPGEIRGGDCDDGDDLAIPGEGEQCPAQAKGGKPGKDPGGSTTTDDADQDGKADAQEVTTLVKLTDTLTDNADTDGDGVSDGSGTGPGGELTPNDNCPRTHNADQTNLDGDLAAAVEAVVDMATQGGDACDTDVDNDGRADKRLAAIDAGGLLVFQDILNTDPLGDNCPLTANADQANSDPDQLGDACDPDADYDGFCKQSLCPDEGRVYTFDLRTGVVNAATTPYTGQPLGPNEVRGGDCNDGAFNINPDQTEVKGDAVDNDCDPGSTDSDYAIEVQVEATTDGNSFDCTDLDGHPCANWMPTDGGTITLTADVSGTADTVAVTFTIDQVTRFPGRYVNDDSEIDPTPHDPCDACAPDFVVTGTGNQRVLNSQDFGGTITIRMTAEYPPGSPLTPVIFTFPQDENTNFIADEWERLLAPELAAAQEVDPSITGFTRNGDHDYLVVDEGTGELNPTRGDGHGDHDEFRGGFWGPGVTEPDTGFQQLVQTTSGPGELYQTPAYLPMGTSSHFRTNPFRPDIYIKFYNYSVIADGRADPAALVYDPPNPLTPADLDYEAPVCGINCPFALGTALIDNAGTDVHIVRADTPAGEPQSVGEQNLDVLVMTNDTATTYGSETGHILRFGKRSWLTGTLGDCPVGNGTGLGPVIDPDPCRTFAIAIGYWFTDAPYRDGGQNYTIAGADSNFLLDAINNRDRVEDKDDDGIRDGGESSIVNDAWLDGDVYLRADIAAGNYEAGNSSTYDIDQDGLIELPTLFGPEDLAAAKEYSQAHVFKVIITHEAVHGLGVGHTQVSTDLMFANVNELDKDGNLSADAKRDLDIFNGRPAP